jgi:hypothetical protein
MKVVSFIRALRVFGWLLWADVRLLAKDFFDNLLDAITWPAFIILVNGWIAPTMGLPADYGNFITVSMIVIMGAYTAWTGSMPIAADLSGPQTISYELTLPIAYWMVWLKNGIYLTLKTASLNMAPLFLGKLILGNQFNLSNFSLMHFTIIYLVASLFFGMFALWATVITKNAESHSRLELRLIGPMFYLNGFTASWFVTHAASPILAWFMRCLPWIYAYEGCRAAVLGQAGYLNIWSCVGMLLFFTALCTASSIHLFKKRMDCV